MGATERVKTIRKRVLIGATIGAAACGGGALIGGGYSFDTSPTYNNAADCTPAQGKRLTWQCPTIRDGNRSFTATVTKTDEGWTLNAKDTHAPLQIEEGKHTEITVFERFGRSCTLQAAAQKGSSAENPTMKLSVSCASN